MAKISVCIPAYNNAGTIRATIENCLTQVCADKEIIIYDDGSSDDTADIAKCFDDKVKVYKGGSNGGVGVALTKAVSYATGDYVVLLCADDLFVSVWELENICKIFDNHISIGHISRYYYQFAGEEWASPLRAWRTKDLILQANNPSGLAFRRKAIINKKFSNQMFIESASMVRQVLDEGWRGAIIEQDTVAVRVHNSTSMKKETYQKFWSGTMTQDWLNLGCKAILLDYATFLQVARGAGRKAVIGEMLVYIKNRPITLINPKFWFYGLFSLLAPRPWLWAAPVLWRKYIGSLITGRV